MVNVISETLYFIASYIGLIIAFFIFVNWLSKGWLKTFIRVKASKGKKSMTICHGLADTYYRVGHFEGSAYRMKDRDGKGLTFTNVDRNDIIHTMGLTGVEIDIPSGNIIKRGVTKPGSEVEQTDNIINRVIMAPNIDDNWKKYVIITLVVNTILLIVITGLIIALR